MSYSKDLSPDHHILNRPSRNPNDENEGGQLERVDEDDDERLPTHGNSSYPAEGGYQ